MNKKMIRFGYACKTIGVPGTAMRTCQLRQATPDHLLEVSRHNLAAIEHMLLYTAQQGLGLLRISSDVIPLASHPAVNFDWQEACKDELQSLSRVIQQSGVRVSMHPGQYTVLNSPHAGVVERSVADLAFHAQFLDALSAPEDAKILLHIGGVYGDKRSAILRFIAECKKLPAFVQRRIALENDDKNFAIDEVMALHQTVGFPVVFDVFHHAVLPAKQGGTVLDWVSCSAATWHRCGLRQKIHYSQQLPQGKPGSHSKTICCKEFMDFYRAIAHLDLDIMLEVKDKNLSAVKCRALCLTPLPRRVLTEEWSRYKYLVLEHSHAAYLTIREYLKEKEPEAVRFYVLLEEALNSPPTPGGIANAAEHVWGHVKNNAGKAAQKRIATALSDSHTILAARSRMKKQLWQLAVEQQEPFLLNSLYFYDMA